MGPFAVQFFFEWLPDNSEPFSGCLFSDSGGTLTPRTDSPIDSVLSLIYSPIIILAKIYIFKFIFKIIDSWVSKFPDHVRVSY